MLPDTLRHCSIQGQQSCQLCQLCQQNKVRRRMRCWQKKSFWQMAGPTSNKCTGDAPMIPMFYVCKVGVDRELQKEKHDCQRKGTACRENMGKWLQIQHSERHQETLLPHSPRRSFSFSSETSSDNSILGVYKLNRTRVEAVESQYSIYVCLAARQKASVPSKRYCNI